MKEVELKAWITPENEERIQKFLDSSCVYIGRKEKYDRNFCKSGLEKKDKKIEFRLREEFSENDTSTGSVSNRKFWVTEKTHYHSKNGVEMNDELEFEVSDGQAFEQLVVSQGFEMFYSKEKLVEQYTQNSNDPENFSILFEKLEVPNLGKFLEVEIVCEEKFLEKAEQKIFSIFQDLQIEEDIEKAPYVVLLGKGNVK